MPVGMGYSQRQWACGTAGGPPAAALRLPCAAARARTQASSPPPTPQMAWFFDHLADLNVTLPFDGESYAMYTILHPVRN